MKLIDIFNNIKAELEKNPEKGEMEVFTESDYGIESLDINGFSKVFIVSRLYKRNGHNSHTSHHMYDNLENVNMSDVLEVKEVLTII